MKAQKKRNAAFDNLTDLAEDYGISLGETARGECISYYEVEKLLTYELEEEIENMSDNDAIELFVKIFS